jgi:hypothetical protein
MHGGRGRRRSRTTPTSATWTGRRGCSPGSISGTSRSSARTGAASSGCASSPSTKPASLAWSRRTRSSPRATIASAKPFSRGSASRRRRLSCRWGASSGAAAPPRSATTRCAPTTRPSPTRRTRRARGSSPCSCPRGRTSGVGAEPRRVGGAPPLLEAVPHRVRRLRPHHPRGRQEAPAARPRYARAAARDRRRRRPLHPGRPRRGARRHRAPVHRGDSGRKLGVNALATVHGRAPESDPIPIPVAHPHERDPDGILPARRPQSLSAMLEVMAIETRPCRRSIKLSGPQLARASAARVDHDRAAGRTLIRRRLGSEERRWVDHSKGAAEGQGRRRRFRRWQGLGWQAEHEPGKPSGGGRDNAPPKK